jgi:hypothetical protein
VGDVELDRPAATRLEVCEQQPLLCSEQVAWVWLAVEQLLGVAPFDDRSSQASQRVAEQLTVCVREIGSVVVAPDQPLRFRDSICEVRRRNVDLPHAGMESLERVRVLGGSDLSRRYGFVVGPERDYEAVTHVDLRLDARVERGDWALGFREPPSKLNFERCARLMRYGRDSGNDVTRQQAQNEPVRVVKNDRVIGRQVKHRGGRHPCRHRTWNFCCLHRRLANQSLIAPFRGICKNPLYLLPKSADRSFAA